MSHKLLVLDTKKTSTVERAPDDLHAELRVAKDAWARAVESQLRLQDAAEAARLVSVTEAEARFVEAEARVVAVEALLQAEARLAHSSARIAELEALLGSLLARKAQESGSLAHASVRFLRNIKDRRVFPHASVRRSLYDKALGLLKGRLDLKEVE